MDVPSPSVRNSRGHCPTSLLHIALISVMYVPSSADLENQIELQSQWQDLITYLSLMT